MTTIKINGHTVAPESQVEGGSHFSPDASESNYIIVQCVDFLKENQYDDFKKLHVEVLTYIGHNTYMCRYRPRDLEKIRELPYVVYANVYHQDLVVEAGLKTRTLQGVAAAQSLKTSPPAPGQTTSPAQTHRQVHSTVGGFTKQEDSDVEASTVPPAPADADIDQQNGPLTMAIGLHHFSDSAKVKQKVAEVLGMDANEVYEDGHFLRVDMKPEDLHLVAALDDVRTIEEFPRFEFFNHVARGNLGLTDPGSAIRDLGISNANIYRGAGEVIVVTDSGFDRGTLDPTMMHPAFTGKIRELFSFRRQIVPPPTDPMVIASQFNDPTGHGTHVCGSIVGAGDSSRFGPIVGTAPLAQLVVQSCSAGAKPFYPRDATIVGLLDRAYLDANIRARISSNSWGIPIELGQPPYGAVGTSVDGMVQAHPDFLVLFAAGNDGKSTTVPSQIGGAAAAKNVLTVGACESTQLTMVVDTAANRRRPPPVQQLDYTYNETQPPGKITNMAAFSSRGPTRDSGRIKPDVVAPGVSIFSALSGFHNTSPLLIFSRFGDFLPGEVTRARVDDFNVSGVTPDPGAKFPALGGYAFLNGTSHATPLVAGCAAVLRQVYISAKGAPPSAAMLKALLVNGAIDLNIGRVAAVARGPSVTAAPNSIQGFGRVNLAKSIQNVTTGTCLDTGPFTQGTSRDYPVTWQDPPDDPGSTSTPKRKMPIVVSATLVWTDPPGDNLVNLMSLKVTAPSTGETRFGNTNHRTNMDTVNNVQKVRWVGVPGDQAVVTVKAERVTGGGDASQEFAVVWTVDLGDSVVDNFAYRMWNQYAPSWTALRRAMLLGNTAIGL